MSDFDETELAEAITKAVSGTLVTKWVVLAEVIDDDGDRTLESLASNSIALWDELGMLAFQQRFREKFIEAPPEDER